MQMHRIREHNQSNYECSRMINNTINSLDLRQNNLRQNNYFKFNLFIVSLSNNPTQNQN